MLTLRASLPDDLSPVEVLTLLVLRALEEAGDQTPRLGDLARLVGCSEKTAQRVTRRLARADLLAVDPNYWGDTGQQTTNSYAVLHWPALAFQPAAEAPDKMTGPRVRLAGVQKEDPERAVEPCSAPVDNPDAELPTVHVELAAAFSSSIPPENESGVLEAARAGVYGEELAQVKERWGEGPERDVADVLHTRASKSLPRPVVLAAFVALFDAKKVELPGAYFRDMLKRSSGGTLGARAAPVGPGLKKVPPRPPPLPEVQFQPRLDTPRAARFEEWARQRQLL